MTIVRQKNDGDEIIITQKLKTFFTEKFDVLRGRLLGNQNDFHRQLGGQINDQLVQLGNTFD